jgi:hypothetical protein
VIQKVTERALLDRAAACDDVEQQAILEQLLKRRDTLRGEPAARARAETRPEASSGACVVRSLLRPTKRPGSAYRAYPVCKTDVVD